jgi:hypothetical protein
MLPLIISYPLLYLPTFQSLASLPEAAAKVITLFTFPKKYFIFLEGLNFTVPHPLLPPPFNPSKSNFPSESGCKSRKNTRTQKPF